MRILKLRFENLNSLYGQWEIDFTGGEYAGNGIFAIVGATGAGKSTVLDAISLSLYGRTPRLGVVSAGSNEVMSRGTGVCSAEVFFEISGVQYSAHWSQKRARERAGGKLQPHKHRLDNISEAKPVAEKVSQTRSCIEELTGMNFDQFTRAMLLAQGDFSKFLKANTNERSEILENITDTADYSLISIAVHERKRREEETLEALKAGLSEILLLNDTEVEQLEFDIADAVKSENNLKKREDELRGFMNLYHSQDELIKSNNALIEQNVVLEKKIIAFSEKKKLLDKAEAVQSCWQDYVRLEKLRNKLDSDNKLLDDNNKLLSELHIECDNCENKYVAQQKHLAVIKEAFVEELKVIRVVRDLDVHLVNYFKRLEELNDEVQKSSESIDACRRSIMETEKEILLFEDELRSAEGYLQDNSVDRLLVDELGGLLRAVDDYAAEDKNYCENARKLDSLVHEKNRLHENAIQEEIHCAEIRDTCLQLNSEISIYQHQLELLLGGKKTVEYKREAEKYRDRQRLLEELEELCIKQVDAALKVEQLRKKVTDCKDTILEIEDSLRSISAAEKDVVREQEHLELGLKYYEQVKTLEKRRAELVAGKECPLCGSLEHPFVENGVPEVNEFDLRLEEVKKRLIVVQEQLLSLRNSCSHEEGVLETATAGLQDAETDYNNISRQVSEHSVLVGIISEDDLKSIINSEIQNNRNILERMTGVIAESDELEKKVFDCKEKLTLSKDSLLLQEKVAGDLRAEESSVTAEEKYISEELKRSEDRLSGLNETLNSAFVKYGYPVSDLDQARFVDIAAQLGNRSDEYRRAVEKSEKCRREVQIRVVRKQELSKTLVLEDTRLHKFTELKTILEQEQNKCSDERHELYGTKDCGVEEERFNTQISFMEKVLTELSEQARVSRENVARCTERIDSLQAGILNEQAELKTMQSEFEVNISERGFNSESEFCASRIDIEALNELKSDWSSLQESASNLKQLGNANQEKMRNLEESLAVAPAKNNVNAELEQVTAERSALLESLGAMKNMLHKHAQMYEQYCVKRQELLKQQDICRRWGNLHQLIGSADGKKFRNFAQGLTFDILLKYANNELQQMNDRYLLRRSAVAGNSTAESLELDVIDKDQAGEIRSAKNLSGGESFIVSLALALGLSNMSSRKIEVNSLFLDEGFGTLDEAELDKVLSALSQIQQRGKLIGIISHVSALKERINLQVAIEKGAGGKSSLIGPGCRRL